MPWFFLQLRRLACCLSLLIPGVSGAASLEAAFNSINDIPLSTGSYTATGNSVNLTLGFAPPVGTALTVVRVTGTAPIEGTHDNLAQGQRVELTFNGIRYLFFANYFGGSGNDLVLEWGSVRPLVWGSNNNGFLGLDHDLAVRIPTAVLPDSVLKGKTVSRAAIGRNHTVVLATDGSLFAWGDNSEGQIGNGRLGENSRVPADVDRSGVLAGKSVVSLVAGQAFTMALCSDGTLVTWGSNNSGTAGNGTSGDSAVPVAVDQTGVLAGKRVVSIAAGTDSCFALCSDGTLAAWGDNQMGQLGDGSNTNRSRPVLVSKTGALAGKTITAVASGLQHTYALCSDGTLAAWGRNVEGQLGNNTLTDSLVPVAVVRTGVLSGKTITSISCGAQYGMALCSDSTLATWGLNNSGQLGIGSTSLSRVPVAVNRNGVLAGKTIVFATAGYNHAYALCSDGTLASWGLNDTNQLGDDTGTNRTLPVLAVSTGLRAGERFNALGSGVTSRQGLVVAASPPPATTVTLAADPVGDRQATLRATANANGTAAALSFEYGTTPALGRSVAAIPASINGSTTTPVSASLGGLLPATTYYYRLVASGTGGDAAGETRSFTTGSAAALAALSTSAGELAPLFQTPLATYRLTVPSATAGISFTPTAAQAGATITVGGNPAVSGSPGPLQPLAPGNNPIQITVTSADGATAFTYTVHVTRLPAVFALESSEEIPVTATGFDLEGKEAELSLRHAPAPGAVITLLKSTGLDPIRGTFSNLAQGQRVPLTHQGVRYEYVADYFGGGGNDLVLRWANTRAVAWGSNSSSELGFATPTQSNSALPVDSSGELSGKTIIATAAGSNTSFALDSDGVVYAWGRNQIGQLGTGIAVTSPVPRKLLANAALAGKRIVAIDAGYNHTLALCSDGTLLSWGNNLDGQLGIGTTTRSLEAVEVDRSGVLSGKRVVRIVASGNFSMALCSDGTLAAWGANESGQLGEGTLFDRLSPVEVARSGYLMDRAVVQITAGESFALALLDDGTLAGWGRNDGGHLGDGTSTNRKLPVAAGIGGALAGKTIVQIRAGSQHSLALCSDGTIAGWGPNNTGALGNNNTTSSTLVPSAVIRTGVLTGRTVTSIAAGNEFSLASCSDGTMAAWGYNSFGELGIGRAGLYSAVPVLQNPSAAYPGSSFAPLSAGPAGTHTVALLAFPPPPLAATLAASAIRDLGATLEGEVNANGSSTSVSFEYGLTESYGSTVAADPTPVSGTVPTPLRANLGNLLGGTTYHYRVVASGPGGKTFGSDATFTTTMTAALAGLEAGGHAIEPAFSQEISRYAVTVPDAADRIVIHPTAASPGAAITVNGIPLPPGGNSLSLSSGANLVTIRVTSPGGDDSREYTVTVTRLPGTILLSSAGHAPLPLSRLDASGQQLGFELRYLPTAGTTFRLFDLAGFTPVSGRFDNLAHGQRVTLAFGGIEFPFVANYYGGDGNDLVLQWANTRLFGWGYNTYGQAGLPPTPAITTPTPAVPSALLQDKTILETASGSTFTIMLMSDGSVFGIGENGSGQLGNPAAGTMSSTPVPVDRTGILNGKTVTSIAVGSTHTLALCSDGTLVSWGDNSSGRLGTGTTTRSPVPVAVDLSGALAGKRVIAIGAGTDHSLAACSDGTVVAWGQNNHGQLGNGVLTNSLVPVPVNRDGALAGKTVTKLFGGTSHSLALCSDGSLAAWGRNVAGQLGDGTTTNSLLPVTVTSTGVLAGKTPAAIAVGGSHQLILCTDGTLVAWGSNFRGQLGIGNNTNSSVPVAVSKTGGLSGKTVTAIAAGTSHSLAVSSDGTGAAWGYDASGQLGNGENPGDNTLPVSLVTSQLRAGERFQRMSAGSSSELSLGIVASPPPPTATTLAATAIRDTRATLNGSVLPNGSSTTLRFEYGLTPGYGNTLAASPATANGTGGVAAAAPLSGLLPGFTYHYRIVADSPGGPSYGEDRTFTTTTLGTLAGLGLSEGTLAPVFELSGNLYVTTVPHGVTSITATPVASHPDASVRVNGVVTPSGTASQPLSLAPGKNTVTVAVTSGDGFNTTSYQVIVTRLPENLAFPAPDSVPLAADDFAATGNAPPFLLGHAPQVGSSLRVIDLTGSRPIRGRFDNLAQGQRVELEFGGILYPFIANYTGGSGNDLVLEWGNIRVASWGANATGLSGSGNVSIPTLTTPTAVDAGGVLAGKTLRSLHPGLTHVVALGFADTHYSWGGNSSGELGDGTTTLRPSPVTISLTGALAGKSVVALAAGSFHTLALCSDGTLAAWGSNGTGQLGNGTNKSSLIPVAVDRTGVLAGKSVISIAAGTSHSLALCQDGTLAAWGNNISGQLGAGGAISTSFSMVPVPVDASGVLAGKRPLSIVAGNDFSMALCDDSNIAGWGSNGSGQLGNNSNDTTSYVPVLVDRSGVLAGKSVTRLAAGSSHAIALLADGSLATWGSNNSGVLGDGTTTDRRVPVLVNRSGVLAGKQIVDADAGGSHSIAVCADGSLATWGSNSSGQLGDGTTTSRLLPVLVPLTSLKPGERFVKGARLSRGNSSHARIASPPAPASESLAASSVTDTGAVLNAAVRPNGSSTSVWFEFGLTPLLGKTLAAEPATLGGTGIQAVTSVLANLTPGTTYHYRSVSSGPGGVSRGEILSFTTTTRATLAGLTASAGVIGPDFDPKTSTYWLTVPAATQAVALTPVVAQPGATVTIAGSPVASGQAGPAVALAPGNNAVQVTVTSADGNATLTYHVTVTRIPGTLAFASAADVPLRVTGFHAAGSLEIRLDYAPAVGTDLKLVDNLGRGFIGGTFDHLPQGGRVRLEHGGIVYEFSTNYHGGDGNDLVLQWANVRPFGWGGNSYGQVGGVLGTGTVLGNESSIWAPVPVIDANGILAGKTIASLSGGKNHSVALCTDGTLVSWGANDLGQLGNPAVAGIFSYFPVTVDRGGALAGKTVVAVAAGQDHTLALCLDGSIAAWGDNSKGQLGTFEGSSSPEPLLMEMSGALAGSGVVAICAGNHFNLALRADGKIAGWGDNSSGQLGDGTTTARLVPVIAGTGSLLESRVITSVAAGDSHVLAIRDDGELFTWGENSSGQLGDGTTTDRPSPVPISSQGLLSGKRVIAAGGGGEHSLVLCSDGTLATWGSNLKGQLADNTSPNSKHVPTRITLPGSMAGKGVLSISCSSTTSHILFNDGIMAGWGGGPSGMLGDNFSFDRGTPTLVHTSALATGERFARITNRSNNHQIALAASPPRATVDTLAADAVADTTATLRASVRANSPNTTVIFEYGTTPSFGLTASASPSSVPNGSTAQVHANLAGLQGGTTYHYRAVASGAGGLSYGESRTFSTGNDAALAALTTDRGSLSPAFDSRTTDYATTVPFTDGRITVTAAALTSSAEVAINGLAPAAGSATAGIDLSAGSNTIEVEVRATASATTRNYRITVIRLPESIVFRNASDRPLVMDKFPVGGRAPAVSLGFAPVTGTGLTLVEQTGPALFNGRFEDLPHGQAVRLAWDGVFYRFVANYFGGDGNDLVLEWADRRIVAWGNNASGQLGNGNVSNSMIPVATATSAFPDGWSPLEIQSSGHSLALGQDGALYAWGAGTLGQLGNGSIVNSSLPVPVDRTGVLAGKTIVRIAAGSSHSLALCEDGTLVAWGSNGWGQLGTGDLIDRSTPVAVDQTGLLAGKTIIAIAAGTASSFAACSDGTVASWGSNQEVGALGNGIRVGLSSGGRVGIHPRPSAVFRAGVLQGRTVVALAAGNSHCYALCSDGVLAAWGSNSNGQLGNNSTANSSVPVVVTRTGVLAGKTIVRIAAGSSHGLALCSDGTLARWGLAIGSTAQSGIPVNITASGTLAGKTVSSVAAGGNNALALSSSGNLAAWGDNSFGQLGNNSTTASSIPVDVLPGTIRPQERPIAAASVGISHLALLASPPSPPAETLAAEAVTGTGATLAGIIHAADGETSILFEYGLDDTYGTTVAAMPALAETGGPTEASAVIAGLSPGTSYHFRVIARSGGNTIKGQDRTFTTASPGLAGLSVDRGSLIPAFSPEVTRYSVTLPAGVAAISITPVAHDPNGVITVNGTTVPSGSSTLPIALQTGDNPISTVVRIPGIAPVSYLVHVTRLPSTFAFDTPGTTGAEASDFDVTGLAASVSLGHAPARGSSLTLLENSGSDPIRGRFSNLRHGESIHLDYNGISYRFVANYHGGDGNDLVLQWANLRLTGWGDNSVGQLGNGVSTISTVLSDLELNLILDGVPLLATAAGSGHSLALAADGTVHAWGANSQGQLGRGDTLKDPAPRPVDATGVLAGREVIALAAGGSHSLALLDNGKVASWGRNLSGELGMAGISSRPLPGMVDDSGVLARKRVIRMASGSSHALALCSDGTLVSWGLNTSGQLGNNRYVNSSVPVRVDNSGILAGKRVTRIAAGAEFSVALCSDGTLASWGSNANGQLGINSSESFQPRPVPVVMTGPLAGKTVTAIAAGGTHCIALCSDGSAVAWGENANGALGDGTTTRRLAPVLVSRGGIPDGHVLTRVNAGADFSVALTDKGTAFAWGNNNRGQLGIGTTAQSTVPAAVQKTTDFEGESFVSAVSGCASTATLAIVSQPPLPKVENLPVEAITATGATLNGLVFPNGNVVAISFEYGLTPACGTHVAATPSTASGKDPVRASATLSGLVSGATYHYRIKAAIPLFKVVTVQGSFTTPDDASLASLGLAPGTLQPDFSPSLLEYWTTLPSSASTIQVTASPARSGATVMINGSSSGSVAVPPGNSTVTVVVTAPSGTPSQSYRIHLTRLPETILYNSADDVPARTPRLDPAGRSVHFALGFAPTPGTRLTVVENTGTGWIDGEFANLAQGQAVNLDFEGRTYRFAANYFGGDGNDLVLEWARNRMFAWGFGDVPAGWIPVPSDPSRVASSSPIVDVGSGTFPRVVLQADGTMVDTSGLPWNGNSAVTNLVVNVDQDGVLKGKKVIRVAAGTSHSIALCSDGTVATWGSNFDGTQDGTLLGPDASEVETAPVLVPVQHLAPGKAVIGIAAGRFSSYAWFEDGTVVAWGSNRYAQLGNNSVIGSARPVRVKLDGPLAGKRVVSVVPGEEHVAALCSDGTVVCWGRGDNGRLGNNSTVHQAQPVAVDTSGILAGKTVTRLAAGSNFTLALCSDGTITGWGFNSQGQLGSGSTASSQAVPVAVDLTGVLAGKTVSGIAGGSIHSLAICSDGSIAGWGAGGFGQIGNGTTSNQPKPVLALQSNLLPGEKFVRLVTGTSSRASYALAAMPQLPLVETLAAGPVMNASATLRGLVSPDGLAGEFHFDYGPDEGYGYSIAATPASGSGTGDVFPSAIVTGLSPGTTYHFRVRFITAAGIYLGEDRSFTTATDAALAGLESSAGPLSPGFDPATARYAISVPSGTPFITLVGTPAAPGATVTVNGLPAGSPVALTPGAIDLHVEVTAPGSGETFRYLVVVNRLPEVLRFDSPSDAALVAREFAATLPLPPLELGFPPLPGTQLTLVRNTGGNPLHGRFPGLPQGGTIDIEHNGTAYRFLANYHGGDGNDLILQWANSRLFGWGENAKGQLGNGNFAPSSLPTLAGTGGPMAGKPVLTAGSGGFHSLARTTDGALFSWGGWLSNVLGNDTVKADISLPVAVPASGALAGKSIAMLRPGRSHNMALCDDGTLVTWGANSSGSLGFDDTRSRALPEAVPMRGALKDRRVASVATGADFTLALCTDGTLAAWGINTSGQLGNNGLPAINIPVPVVRDGLLAGKTVSAITTGASHSLVLCEDGSLFAWGLNADGQLGDGSNLNRLSPVAVDRSGILAGKQVTAIAAGDQQSFALCSDGTVAAWGRNTNGQLGNGTQIGSNRPVAVDFSGILGGKSVVSLIAGADHTLAACSDGTLVAWGRNHRGQLADGTLTDRSYPVEVSTLTLREGERLMPMPASHGGTHTLMLAGSPLASVTTLAAREITGTAATLAGSVQANRNAVTVSFEYGLDATYGDSTAALPANASGIGTTSASARISGLKPSTTYHYRAVVEGVGGIVRGEDRTFTTLSDNALLSSLTITEGVIGPDFDPQVTTYHVSVPAGTGSVTVNPATAHPRATSEVQGATAGSVALTGERTTVTITVTAEDRETLKDYTLIVTRLPATFLLGDDAGAPLVVDGFSARGFPAVLRLNHAPVPGSIFTVVRNTGLGFIHGTFSNLARGQRVALVFDGLEYDFVANYQGGDGNDLVLQWANTRTFGWGLNSRGQLGDGSTTRRLAAVATDESGVLAGKTVTAISGGSLHSLALCSDGSVAAWGYNSRGQLGNGSTTDRSKPVAVDFSDAAGEVVAISAGAFHSLALRADGRIAAWGYNNHGQLGTGNKVTYLRPVPVPAAGALAGKQVVAIAAGSFQSFALCSDGTVAAWGRNDAGELGDGTTTPTSLPVAVDRSGILAGKTVASIAAGQDHQLALCTDGTLVAWGDNRRGKLGNGTTLDAPSPVAVDISGLLSGKSVVELAAGDSHSLVRCSDGTVAAWGSNQRFQLGNGSTLASRVPVAVTFSAIPAGKTLASVSAGRNHNLARFRDGTLAAWGENTNGQLGNLSTTAASRPIMVNLSATPPGSRAMFDASGPDAQHSLAVLGLSGSRPAAGPSALAAVVEQGETDTDRDGVPDLLELAFGLDPSVPHDGTLPMPQLINGKLGVSFTEPAGGHDFIYGAECSESLEPGTWKALPDTGSGPWHEFKLPVGSAPRMFMRLTVQPAAR